MQCGMLPNHGFHLHIQIVVIWSPSLHASGNVYVSWIPTSYPEDSGAPTSHSHDNAQQKATAFRFTMLEISHWEGNAFDLVLVRVVVGSICCRHCNCLNVHGHHPIQSHMTRQMPALNAVVICICPPAPLNWHHWWCVSSQVHILGYANQQW